MKRRRRTLVIVFASLAALVLLGVAIVHAPGIQTAVWRSVAHSIEESTGWRIDIDNPAFRLFPARFIAEDTTVSNAGTTVATVERLEVHWKWRRLMNDPRRVEKIVVGGLEIDVDGLASIETVEDAGSSEVDLWRGFEIGSLVLDSGRVAGSAVDISGELDGLAVEAEMVEGVATAAFGAKRLAASRGDRLLEFGPLELRAKASADGVEVAQLTLDGEDANFEAQGYYSFAEGGGGRADFSARANLASATEWWDPNVATGLAPAGRLDLHGSLSMTAGAGLEIEVEHRGAPFHLAGYEFERMSAVVRGGEPRVRMAGGSWGVAEVGLVEGGTAEISANFQSAPVDQVLVFAAPQVASYVSAPATLTGILDATIAYPITTDTLAGRADLELVWPDGRIAIKGEGAGDAWRIESMEAVAAGLSARGSGKLEIGGRFEGGFEISAPNPREVVENLRPWLALPDDLNIDGGPVEATVAARGTTSDPYFSSTVMWADPEVMGRRLRGFELDLQGNLREVEWALRIDVVEGAALGARGVADPSAREIRGEWDAEVFDLPQLAALFGPDEMPPFTGEIRAGGDLALSQEHAIVDGSVEAQDLSYDGWIVPWASAGFSATPSVVQLDEIFVEALEGTLEGKASAALGDGMQDFRFDGVLRDLDLAALPFDVPEPVLGLVSGTLCVGGALDRPDGSLELVWDGAGTSPIVETLRAQADLSDGVLRVAADALKSLAGATSVDAEIPLGDLPLPDWVWPEAPGGPVVAYLRSDGFRSGSLTDALGIDAYGIDVAADLQADLTWDPIEAGLPHGEVVARRLQIHFPSGDLAAESPLIATYDDGRLEVAPVVLVGLDSRIEVEAVFDPEADEVDGRVRSLISPGLARLMPIPLRVRGPLRISSDFHIPASTATSFETWRAVLEIDHGDGTLVMRDPPLEIRGTRVSARLRDGHIDITDGEAEVNRGTVILGGGWNPETGQGVILGLENVTLYLEGILTKWDGNLAIEPRDGVLAHVAGDLSLTAGLWDETFNFASAVLGGGDLGLAADDPLHDISLDINVRGRAGIRVHNNLGQFDASWDTLRIDGTAAAPRIRGEVRIAPGGVIGLGGREVVVRRGGLEFTGDPAVDPILEIVPESGMTLLSSDESGDLEFDPTLMATRGLAQGISSVLGFENETLQPAEIAGQTERDPSVNFMVGQRLNRYLALFISANLTDVQDRMTMLQAWNFRGLRGLVLQAYQETLDDNVGGTVMQRFSWGATTPLQSRPEIHRLRLEGDWPMSKKYLKKATRLRRGQPFDPFLLFVASVRMERALAENGYQNARVTAFQEGDERSPALVFYCEPGEPQFVQFLGDSPPRTIRAEVTSLYRPPPLENSSLREMSDLVRRYFALDGFPDAEVSIDRLGDLIVVNADMKGEVTLNGPYYDGLPGDIVARLGPQLGSDAVAAAASKRPGWVARSIEQRLANLGFLEARVESVDLTRLDAATAEIRITVDPGPREMIDEVVFDGDDPLGILSAEGFRIGAGNPLDRTAVDLAARDVRDAYVEAGYLHASARGEFRQGDDGRWIVEINLDPGTQRRLREVRYAGVKHTSKRVLNKGLAIQEGEVLTDQAVDLSASQIANFSPVERVEVRTREVGPSEIDVELDVFEKPRWIAEVGGGWSTEKGFAANFGLRDDNLLGRGFGLNLRGGWGSTERKIFLIGSLPPVPSGRLTLISTVGYLEGDAPDEPDLLDQEEKLLSLEAQYALTNRVQLGVYYRFTDTRTFEKEPDPFFPFDVRVKIGTVGTRAVVDKFDNLFDPRRGHSLTTDLGWSTEALGSDLDYVSWLSGFSLALTPFTGATWLQTARVGVAEPLKGQNLVRDSRYFAGGQSSIRGFDLNSVGPLTFGVGGELVPAGGGALFILNEELRIPIRGALRAAVFADIGQVWESWREAEFDLAIGVGLGVRWSTPIGPLWADVAWPVADIGISSKKAKFYLGIGRPF